MKAIRSLRRSAEAFNSFEEEGRVTAVLLHLQHAFEMLLKAGLRQKRVPVFDEKQARSLSFERCVNIGGEHLGITATEAGLLRVIDALRDQEQHWFLEISEGLLYSHVRAAVTLFDELLQRALGERLVDYLPSRILPVSAEPPQDIQLLLDEEYSQIQALLQPGRRRSAEAKARIRCLLALEAHVAGEVVVSATDVDRLARAIRMGQPRDEALPRLADLATEVAGEGLQVTVHFSKRRGAPVRYVAADDPTAAAAVRAVDLQKKYHVSRAQLAKTIGLTDPKCLALRRKLGIDTDERCCHDFVFGKSTHRMFSDNAVTALATAVKTEDMDEVWRNYRTKRPRAGVS